MDEQEKKKFTEIKDELTWWLGKKPFILNGEYKIEMLFIDWPNKSCKIKITNLKNKQETVQEVSNG